LCSVTYSFIPKRYPDYYQLIPNPISMLRIQAWSQKPMHYQTLAQYRADWHLLFQNARDYNMPGSRVFMDADFLQK
ncbi:Bromodomain-containing protein, partial [Mycena alexandri]